MKRGWWYRFTFLLVATITATILVIPTVMKFDKESNFPVKSRINLGLDLQGGLYMIMGIDFNEVYQAEIEKYAIQIQAQLKDNNIQSRLGTENLNDIADPRYSIVLNNPSQAEAAKSEIKSFFGTLLRLTSENGNELEYALSQTTKLTIEQQAVSKSIEVIRNRIDEFGVTEPEITSQGKDRIVIQLPGVKDIERAKALIGKTAKLEFKIVNDEIPASTLLSWVDKAKKSGIEYKKGAQYSKYISDINKFLKNDLPKGFTLAFERKVNKFNNETVSQTPYLVEAVSKVTGDALQDARVTIDQQKNQPLVAFELKSAGAKAFGELTGSNVGKRLAIVLDGNVYSAPNINEKIGGGRGQISLGSGGYNAMLKEARDLALVLRAGALPVDLKFLEQRSVGPTLGQDSINKARFAGLVGAVLVFVFIVSYYRISGFIAMMTLGLNILFVLAALVTFEATLTLPGIAGIALTIGMAVDANIIIYERIREEVKKGIGYYKAVENGFEHAFWTIIDANITTALAGICLLNFGTGPIRGFAVTLLIGIFATVYTSYFVGRLLFEFYMDKVEGQDLSI